MKVFSSYSVIFFIGHRIRVLFSVLLSMLSKRNHPSCCFSLFSVYEAFSISIVVNRNFVLKLFMSVLIIALRFIFSCGLGIPYGSAFF